MTNWFDEQLLKESMQELCQTYGLDQSLTEALLLILSQKKQARAREAIARMGERKR